MGRISKTTFTHVTADTTHHVTLFLNNQQTSKTMSTLFVLLVILPVLVASIDINVVEYEINIGMEKSQPPKPNLSSKGMCLNRNIGREIKGVR